MCGLMLVLCYMDALWVLVSFCQRLLKKSVVIQERLCVHTGLRSDYNPSSPGCAKGGLSDQGSGRGSIFWWVLLLYRHVFFVFFFTCDWKPINSSNLCMCVYSEVPRRVRKIPHFFVIAITFHKCEMMRLLDIRSTIEQFWKAPAINSNLFHLNNALKIF